MPGEYGLPGEGMGTCVDDTEGRLECPGSERSCWDSVAEVAMEVKGACLLWLTGICDPVR